MNEIPDTASQAPDLECVAEHRRVNNRSPINARPVSVLGLGGNERGKSSFTETRGFEQVL